MAGKHSRLTLDGKEADRDNKEMDLVRLPDRGGNTITLQRFEGKYYIPYYRPEDLRGVRKFQMRSGDIVQAGYIRSGTHWIYENTYMLMNGKAETYKKSKLGTHIEFNPAKSLEDLPSPRILNTHMRFPDIPEQLVEKKCKVIYSMRDPKDVAVSMYFLNLSFSDYYEYNGHFKDFLYLFLEGKVECSGVFGHFRDTENFIKEHPKHPLHIVVYEEMKKNPFKEVKRLSDFLEVNRSDELCQAIADKCAFSRMVVDKDEYTMKVGDTNPLYRKGTVGDWRNYFTDEMLDDYYRVYEEKMAGSRFYDLYSRENTT